MKRPSVSVCVPVYNAEKYLSECLDSLLNQSLKSIEIICVDDGSTDSSGKMLDEYAKKNKNIKVIHQINTGLGGARDAGVMNSHGEFIGFVDADDKVDGNMYESLYVLAKNANAEISYCGVKLSDANAKKAVWFNQYNGQMTGDFLYRNTQPTNKIFSKALFRRLNARFEGDDGICNYLMVKARGIASIDDEYYYYRLGHESMSSSFKIKNLISSVDAAIRQKNIVDNDPDLSNDLKDYFTFMVINNAIQTMAVSASYGNKDVYKAQKSILKQNDYRRNSYCRKIYRKEQGFAKYVGIMYVLPKNYLLSRFLINKVLGGELR